MRKLLFAVPIVLIILAGGLFLYLSNRGSLTSPLETDLLPRPFKPVEISVSFTVTSEIPKLKVSFVDEKAIRDQLASNNVSSLQNVEVKIVTKTSKDAFLSQKDKEGKMVIESSLDVSNPKALVEIALGEFVLSQNEEKIASWINSHFWQAIELLASYQTQTKQEIGGFPAFVVEKT